MKVAQNGVKIILVNFCDSSVTPPPPFSWGNEIKILPENLSGEILLGKLNWPTEPWSELAGDRAGFGDSIFVAMFGGCLIPLHGDQRLGFPLNSKTERLYIPMKNFVHIEFHLCSQKNWNEVNRSGDGREQ